jgi:hypothetical protein
MIKHAFRSGGFTASLRMVVCSLLVTLADAIVPSFPTMCLNVRNRALACQKYSALLPKPLFQRAFCRALIAMPGNKSRAAYTPGRSHFSGL